MSVYYLETRLLRAYYILIVELYLHNSDLVVPPSMAEHQALGMADIISTGSSSSAGDQRPGGYKRPRVIFNYFL